MKKKRGKIPKGTIYCVRPFKFLFRYVRSIGHYRRSIRYVQITNWSCGVRCGAMRRDAARWDEGRWGEVREGEVKGRWGQVRRGTPIAWMNVDREDERGVVLARRSITSRKYSSLFLLLLHTSRSAEIARQPQNCWLNEREYTRLIP